jgi:CzcA family heavy metal efflux pump
MLKGIVETSIRSRVLVIVLACALVAYGFYTAQHAKLDVFPDFVQPQAVIQTEAPGLSPEQVEALVTGPVETTVHGVMNIEAVRSQSIQGLSIVTVIFKEGTNIFTARQMLTEQLAAIAEQLPSGVKPPRLTPLTSATMDLLKIGLTSDKMTLMELRSFVDWTLRPRLKAVTGIADVGVMGGEVRQLQVQIDPGKLLAHNLSAAEVIDAARNATGTRGAGFIDTANQRIVLQSDGQALTPEQLGEAVVVARQGSNLCLRDVAEVKIAPEPKFGDAMIMGRPGVLVKLLSQYGSNTMEVTRAVEKALNEEMLPVFKANGIDYYLRMHRPATFIENALYHMKQSLLIGAVLVIVVLFLFLFNLRTAFISITAIPLSLLMAILILDRFGLTLNTITLGGLAIALGEVVDDAIIDVENIFRRLKENRALGSPRSPFKVVLDASLEVRSAVVYATFVVVMMFIPVLTMSGLQGRMFAPLGIAYILAILASLAVALTVTPALSMVLLPRATAWAREPFFVRWMKAAYHWILSGLSQWPRLVTASALAMVLLAASLLGRFGEEFLPEFREGHFVIQISAVPGTSLPEMMRIGQRISNDLLNNVKTNGRKVIDTVEEQAGRAELGEDPWGPHRAEIHVELKPDVPGAQQAEVQQQIRDLLAKYPGLSTEVLTFLGDRIGETITGETAGVVISLFGDDLDVLDHKAREIEGIVRGIRGAADVRVASPPGSPQMLARLRSDRLRQFGLTPLEVLNSIEDAYQGTRASQVYEGSRVFDVTVILAPELRREPEDIGSLMLRNGSGTTVRLSEVADVFPRTGRYMILHEGARRRQAVTCNVEGRDLTGFVEEAKQKVASVQMPGGMYAVWGGAAEEREAAQRELLLHSGLAGLGIVLLLANVFRRWQNLMLVLANLPFAFVGGVLAVYLTGGVLSIGSLVGFVTLFGITMRNSVMMVSHYEHLVGQEGMTWGLPAAIRGASERLMPVLMTALVTGLGLLPIALGTGEVGREIEGPMAVVILGGLTTSTLLNLLILPTLALWFGRFDNKPEPTVA